jgi:hypothetical protein
VIVTPGPARVDRTGARVVIERSDRRTHRPADRGAVGHHVEVADTMQYTAIIGNATEISRPQADFTSDGRHGQRQNVNSGGDLSSSDGTLDGHAHHAGANPGRPSRR